MTTKNIHFTSQACFSSFEEIFRVFVCKLDSLAYAVQLFNRNRARSVKSIRYADRMNAAIKESFTLLEKGTSKDC